MKTSLVSLFKIFAALRCRDTRTLPRIFAIQIVLNTPKNPYLKTWLAKFLPNFPARKNPEAKISSPQKSFDHPCHLKSGVTPAPLSPPLGSVPNSFYFFIGISLCWIRAIKTERENEIIYVFFLVMTSKKQNSISFWYSLQIQGGDPNPNPPPPRRRKSFQIKVTVSIFKLVKVPAILNTKFRFDGSMVGGGGGGSGSGGGKQEPVTRSEQLPC